jgi:hypothetical protein
MCSHKRIYAAVEERKENGHTVEYPIISSGLFGDKI